MVARSANGKIRREGCYAALSGTTCKANQSCRISIALGSSSKTPQKHIEVRIRRTHGLDILLDPFGCYRRIRCDCRECNIHMKIFVDNRMLTTAKEFFYSTHFRRSTSEQGYRSKLLARTRYGFDRRVFRTRRSTRLSSQSR